MTFTPTLISQNGTPNGKTYKDNVNRPNGNAFKGNSSTAKHEERPVSVHGNLINNQSIYANTMMVPKMNGTSSTGKGLSLPTDHKPTIAAKPSFNLNIPTPSTATHNSFGPNLNISSNALLNTSKISSSNSPSTNGTNTTGMDSSRDNPEFDLSTRVSPQTAVLGCNVNLSRTSSHRHAHLDTQNINYPSSNMNSLQNRLHLNSLNSQQPSLKGVLSQESNKAAQNNSQHNILNTTKPQMFNTSDILSPGEKSFTFPHNSTLAPNANLNFSQNTRSHNQSRSTNNSFFNASFIPTRNVNGQQRAANMTHSKQDTIGPTSGYGGKLKMMNSSLIPENVSKFMQKSKEVGIKDAITSLGLLCVVSLLLALLSLVFLLKLSPVTEERRRELYRFNFLSAKEYVLVYEVTLGMCAIALSLNLCCLLVSSIQFFLAVKLVKSSPIHGRIR